MEKSVLAKEKMNIQLNESERNAENGSFIKQKKKSTTFLVSDPMLAGIEQNRISGSNSVNVRIFPGATHHDMYDYLKPILKKNPDNIILHIGNNSVNETSRDILNRIISLKNFAEKISSNMQSYCIKYNLSIREWKSFYNC